MDVKYSVDTFVFDKLRKCIEIPRFQRGVVWNSEKRKAYINTVLQGLPFGSMLLYKQSPEKFLLVDGLQRYTALDDFFNCPETYITIEKEEKEKIESIIKILQESGVQTDFKTIKSDLTDKIKQEFTLAKDVSEIVEAIFENISILEQNSKCYRMLFSIIETMQSRYNISSLEIPLVIYQGDYNSLPYIFEKVNSTGTILSRYDIFAATWSPVEFDYNDVTILNIIDKKYKDRIKETGVEILNYTPGQISQEKRINLYEFCCAFGKQLKNECPHIFLTKTTASKDVDSIGFMLLGAVIIGEVDSLDKVKKYFDNAGHFSPDDLFNFKEKILECAKKVQTILDGYIMTIDNKTNLAKAIESQIVTIVASLFKIRYSLSPNSFTVISNPNSRKMVSDFERYMPKRYLYDILRNRWKGSGDTTLKDELSAPIENNSNLLPITKDSWEAILMDWMNDLSQKTNQNITSESKLFLNYIIRKQISKIKYDGRKFDFKFVITKKRFEGNFGNKPGKIAIGNICILPEHENRSAKELTLYEDETYRKTISNINPDILEDFLYPEESELSFTKSPTTFTYDGFLRFLKNRQEYLKNKFLSLFAN